MPKGAYDVNEPNVGPTKDGSFRSMLCAMLVFVAICGIILIVAWPWRNSSDNGKSSSGNYLGSADSQTGSKYNKSHPTTATPVTERNYVRPENQPIPKTSTSIEFTNEPTKKPQDIDIEFVTKSQFDPSGTTKQSEKIQVPPDNQPSEPVPETTKKSATVAETTTVSVTADLSNRFNPVDTTTTEKINIPTYVRTTIETINFETHTTGNTKEPAATINNLGVQLLGSTTTTDSSKESTTNNLESGSSGSNTTPNPSDLHKKEAVTHNSATVMSGSTDESSKNLIDASTTPENSKVFVGGQNTTPNPSEINTEATTLDSSTELPKDTDKSLIDSSTTTDNSKGFMGVQNTTPNPSDSNTEATTIDLSTELPKNTDKSLVDSSTPPDNSKGFVGVQNTTPNPSDSNTEATTIDLSTELPKNTDKSLIDSSTTTDNSKGFMGVQNTTPNPSDSNTEATTIDLSTELPKNTDKSLDDSSTTPENSKVFVVVQNTTPNPSDSNTEAATPDSSTELPKNTGKSLVDSSTTTDNSKVFVVVQNTTPNPSDSNTEATTIDSSTELPKNTDKSLIDSSTTTDNSKGFMGVQNTTPNPSDSNTEATTIDLSTELPKNTDKSLVDSSTTPENSKVFVVVPNTTPNPSDSNTEATTIDSSTELPKNTDKSLIDSSTTTDNSKGFMGVQNTTPNPSDSNTEATTIDLSTELPKNTDKSLVDSSTTPENSKVFVVVPNTTPNPSDSNTEATTIDSSTELPKNTDKSLIDSSTTTDNSKGFMGVQNTTPNPSDSNTEATTIDLSTELPKNTDKSLVDSSTTPENSKVFVVVPNTTPNPSDSNTEATTIDSSTELPKNTDKSLVDSSTTPANSKVFVVVQNTTPNPSDSNTKTTTPDSSSELPNKTDKNLIDSSTTPDNSKQTTTPNPPNLENTETTTRDSTEPPEKSTTIISTYREILPSNKDHTAIPAIMETSDVDEKLPSTQPPKPTIQNIDECNAECRKVGARILSRMNHAADPCERFYDYACGGDNIDNAPEDNWRQIAGGLDGINEKSSDAYKTFRNFYDSCVDFHTDYDNDQRVAEAKQILSSVGQPYKDSVDEKSALTDLLTRLLQLDSSPLFDISVDVDKESQHFIFQLNIGKHFSTLQNDNTILSTRRKCINKSKKHFDFSISHFNSLNLNEMYTAYLNCLQNETYNAETVEKALVILDFYDELEHSIGHIEDILMTFKELPSAASIRKDILMKKFDIRKVAELEYHYPLIEWKKILTNLVGQEVHDEDLVQVYFKDFFFKLFSRKQTLTIPELHDTILTMYIHDLYTKFVLPTQMSNPEEFCLHHSSDLMKEIASSLYLESIKIKDTEEDLKRVNDLFDAMKTKLQEMIQNDAQWINVSPRISLTKKINSMVLDTAWNKIPLWDTTLIQERMKSVNRIYGNYSDFATALVRRNREMLYSMWDTKSVEENNVWWYFLTPYSNNPVSIYALNRIAIPPAMLFTKSKDIPRYLSLAKLGYSLAKAVSYHFDYTGSKYSMSLDRKAEMAYDETKTCTILSYLKKFEVEHDGKNVQFQVNNDSLVLSLNERFVEDMTINLLSAISNEAVTDYQISWIASNPELTKLFSREKMFFIALGQEHCRKPNLEDYFLHLFESEHLPPSLLLDTALSHSELFKDVFYCKEGSRMDAMFKCSAFPAMQDVEEDYS